MNSRIIAIPVEKIVDWASFHQVFKETLGFPDYYGRNMDAWIDCMTYVDEPDADMSAVTNPGEILVLQIDNPFEFRKRCPEQYGALIECSAFVNFRRSKIGAAPVLALLFSGC
jgi:RNAse (barnase) inhibitor barstar